MSDKNPAILRRQPLNPVRRLFNLARTGGVLVRYRTGPWLAGYLGRRRRSLASLAKEADLHIMVALVDHYEPSRKLGAEGVRRVYEWCDQYKLLTQGIVDDDGRAPQHSWFYRYDYPNFECLVPLSKAVYEGFGEIEFHLHHGHDTPQSFRDTIMAGREWFSKVGAMLTLDNLQARFAYIAGNWALANGQDNPATSGVNEELAILRECGCYADFTFPAFGERSQPTIVNQLYYGASTDQPKGYERGVPMRVGGQASGDLLLFQGPLFIDISGGGVDYSAVESYAPYVSGRWQNWLKADVHIDGRPNWLFVKLHTHGMQSADTVVGASGRLMYEELVAASKALGAKLHFVNAREAYNIAKAAEAGLIGNPGDYRDYEIARPVGTRLWSTLPYRAMKVSQGELQLEFESGVTPCEVLLKDYPLISLKAAVVRSLTISHSADATSCIQIDGEGEAEIVVRRSQSRDHETRLVGLPCEFVTD